MILPSCRGCGKGQSYPPEEDPPEEYPPSEEPSNGALSPDELARLEEADSHAIKILKNSDICVIIAATLPKTRADYRKALFAFARQLKAFPHLADADPKELRPIIQRWHELALPIIGPQPLEEILIDFLPGLGAREIPGRVGTTRRNPGASETKPPA